MTKPTENFEKQVTKIYETSMELSKKVQDESFKMAEKQIDAMSQMMTLTLNSQKEMMAQFRQTMEMTRDMYQNTLNEFTSQIKKVTKE